MFRDEHALEKTEQKTNCKKNKNTNTENRFKLCRVCYLQ